jgi:hypothetical protein
VRAGPAWIPACAGMTGAGGGTGLDSRLRGNDGKGRGNDGSRGRDRPGFPPARE